MTQNNKRKYSIEVEDVYKDFKVYYDKGCTLKERLLFWQRNRKEVRHILQGINFKVKTGEVLGLIGENGAGKSTTLKLLSKIIYPNKGNIIMHGRVACLIELGAGFHPDMTGRENIYTNASIFGLSRKEIDTRMNDIIAFSELEAFIDNPVRTYSSGMYMRLAFSVAINVDADILLIDEILAVGDAAFQAKCFNKLLDIKAAGTTIVIVSHTMSQIQQICDRAIWFKNSKIEQIGDVDAVTECYMEYMARKNKDFDSTSDSADVNLENKELKMSWKANDLDNCTNFGYLDVDENMCRRWISDDDAVVMLAMPCNISFDTCLQVEFYNALLFKYMKHPLEISIYVDNYHIGNYVCIEGSNKIIVNITEYIKRISYNIIKVQLKVNYLWIPKNILDDSIDIRSLGVALQKIEIFQLNNK